jgi:uncharacterized membrane protein
MVARAGAIGDTPMMPATPSPPPPTLYHRWLGWHAPDLRRAAIVAAVGLAVAAALQRFVIWGLAAVAGWDAAAVAFLASSWAIILRADSAHTHQLAGREDATRGSAAVLLAGASVASLLGAGFVLRLAGQESGPPRALLVGVAGLTVVLSWAVVNTVYTLRYAHLYFGAAGAAAGGAAGAGIAFGDASGQARPTYRDFAYVAFTVGMTYQVSDTTVGDPRIRRAVLAQALLAYLFGVVIIGGSVNLIAGLLR